MGTKEEQSVKKGLSKREALALIRMAGQNKMIITINDIKNSVDISYSEARKTSNG